MKKLSYEGVIGIGLSRAADPSIAVEEAFSNIDLAAAAFLMVFIPSHLDLPSLSKALEEKGDGVAIFGCTTAGQITDLGYEDDALLVISFTRAHFRCASVLVSPLKPISLSAIASSVETTAKKFSHTATWNRFALVMADGLCKQEDTLLAAIETVLPDVPVFGGSAGDGLSFEKTHVLHGGRVHTNAGLLILIETNLSFVGLGFDHFQPTDKQLVVTNAIPDERVVCEFNGSPAAAEYARMIGYEVDDLLPEVFAENPLLVRNGSSFHVRAVQQVIDGSCLTFLSAIDDGLVMTLGKGAEILETLSTELGVTDPAKRAPIFILGFECILRKLEFEQKKLCKQVSETLVNFGVFGFSTYGEQHRGVHVNQTFVGVAFFPPNEGDIF